MYNKTMDSTKTDTLRENEYLTRGEINNLKKQVLGYGKFKRMALRLEMPVTTLRDVINKGYGEPDTIVKIRKAFTEDTTNIINNNQ
jgi:hypothetical protein